MSGLTPEEKVQKSIREGREFIAKTRAKMNTLVEEFAAGKLNREQFHQLYDRYQAQISGVQAVLYETDPSKWSDLLDDEHTYAIRKRLMAKAIGMAIYNDQNGTLLETLGDFSVDPLKISQLILQLTPTEAKKESVTPEEAYPKLVVEIGKDDVWVMLTKGQYTTVVVIFSREPTTDQQETITQLLQDFERANGSYFLRPTVVADDLAIPFRAFIKYASLTAK